MPGEPTSSTERCYPAPEWIKSWVRLRTLKNGHWAFRSPMPLTRSLLSIFASRQVTFHVPPLSPAHATLQYYAPAMLVTTPNDGRLPLDDPYWQGLDHRGGHGGPDVRTELAALVSDPEQEERFQDLWPYLCSEGTTWPAAYAATPYLVDLAGALPPRRRVEHITALGLIAAHGAPADAPDRLVDAYVAGLSRAVSLAAETLAQPVATSDLVWLLAAVAALHGQVALAQVLPDIDSVCEPCPQCGTKVRFTALESALRAP